MSAKFSMFTTASLCLGLAAAGCASTDDVRALRRPVLPPSYVALADRETALHESIAIYEILGAPEFRLFDGGALYTTRPTRGEVARMLRAWLSNADMLAEDIGNSRYLLTVTFEDLHGPNVMPFSDKRASASVRYDLVDRRSGAMLFTATYDATIQARMPGVTEEMVRAAVVGGVLGVAAGEALNGMSDRTDAAVGAGLAGSIIGADAAGFASAHDTLLWDWPVAMLEALPRIDNGAGFGLGMGLLAANAADGASSDVEAQTLGGVAGALTGFVGAAPTGRPPTHWQATEVQGSFWGGDRRDEAVRGMMRQNYNQFLFGLRDANLLVIRAAVTCDELNPGGIGIAYISSTADAVGYDCPGSSRR